MVIQLKSKEIKEEKVGYVKAQNGKCVLCSSPLGEDLSKIHLDHDHSLEGDNAGKVRGALCNLCNVLEGTIKHKYNSSGLVKHGIDYTTWLKDLVKYLESDYSSNNFHPHFIPDKVKQFSRLTKPEMLATMASYNFSVPEKPTREVLTKEFRKQFRKYQHNLKDL